MVKSTAAKTSASISDQVEEALRWLQAHAKPDILDHYEPRYGIVVTKAFGVAVSDLHRLAKTFGKNHDLAQALWATGWYEARLLAAFVGEPARVTATEMDRWCKDFDNWGICDTICFHLWDRTPLAFAKIRKWEKQKGEYQRRASFALLASVALHDKEAADLPFLDCLPLIEAASTDERNFVKKAVSWALRGIGRRNAALNTALTALAKRLSTSADSTQRWIGKDALRDLASPAMTRRLASRPKVKPKRSSGRGPT